MEQNSIGLSQKKTTKTINELNLLLANYQQFYMNLRGFHWNVKGSNFFELHLKFEELYNDLNLKVDEIAERILALDGVPIHSFSDYQEIAQIQEVKGVVNGMEMVTTVLSDFKLLISQERGILEEAGNNKDEGTIALMSDYIIEQEKIVWMLRSYLG